MGADPPPLALRPNRENHALGGSVQPARPRTEPPTPAPSPAVQSRQPARTTTHRAPKTSTRGTAAPTTTTATTTTTTTATAQGPQGGTATTTATTTSKPGEDSASEQVECGQQDQHTDHRYEERSKTAEAVREEDEHPGQDLSGLTSSSRSVERNSSLSPYSAVARSASRSGANASSSGSPCPSPCVAFSISSPSASSQPSSSLRPPRTAAPWRGHSSPAALRRRCEQPHPQRLAPAPRRADPGSTACGHRAPSAIRRSFGHDAVGAASSSGTSTSSTDSTTLPLIRTTAMFRGWSGIS